MIELGGNIKIEGIDAFDKGSFIILKKMVSTFVKEISEGKNLNNFELNLSVEEDSKIKIKVKLVIDDKEIKSEITHNNLFIGLNEIFNELKFKIGGK